MPFSVSIMPDRAKATRLRVESHAAEADKIQRAAQACFRGADRVRAGCGKMIAEKHPQGLNRRIECAVARFPERIAGLQERDQIGRRRRQSPDPVQFDKRGICPVEAEYAFQPRHLDDDPLDKPIGCGAVVVVDCERG